MISSAGPENRAAGEATQTPQEYRRIEAMGRALAALMAFVLTVPLGATPAVRLPDLDNRPVDPFLAAEDSKAIVFLFTSVECPISNRYAPVVQRLYERFSAQGVRFWLVYPNPSDSPAAIRDHLKAFNYPVHALRDPKHDLVKLTKVSVTPEVAVYDRARALVYRGRIDDRYVSLGLERPAPTRQDLAEVLTATLAGKPVRDASTQAVGCFIADFVR
jgi:AhpC/TSA family protein